MLGVKILSPSSSHTHVHRVYSIVIWSLMPHDAPVDALIYCKLHKMQARVSFADDLELRLTCFKPLARGLISLPKAIYRAYDETAWKARGDLLRRAWARFVPRTG